MHIIFQNTSSATVRKPRDPGQMLGLKQSAHPTPAYDPTGKSMKEVWFWLMRPPNKGILPSTISSKQHRNLINQLDRWYRPLALDSELAILKDPTSDHGHCLRILDNIDKLLALQLQVCNRRLAPPVCMYISLNCHIVRVCVCVRVLMYVCRCVCVCVYVRA